jgi:hypothetical protein
MAGFTGADNASARNTLFPPDDPAQIWPSNNPVGTETLQSVGMPQPTTYAGPVGQFVNPQTGELTTQGQARLADNPALGFDTGGLGPVSGLAGIFKAYHGSPHDFSAFDLSKIGTGEGAQAYGHGMYLADAEGTARQYRDNLGIYPALQKLEFNADKSPNRPGQVASSLHAGYSPDEIAEHLKVLDPSATDQQIGQWISQGRGVLDDVTKTAGHMYEVEVNADPAHFLDWDKPLSEQHPVVRGAVNSIADNSVALSQRLVEAARNNIPLTGNDVVSTLARSGDFGDPRIAQALQNAGIPGIRYLDQGSRGAGEGSRNTVVFSPEIMNIIRKYGIAGLMAGGAGAAGLGGTRGSTEQ